MAWVVYPLVALTAAAGVRVVWRWDPNVRVGEAIVLTVLLTLAATWFVHWQIANERELDAGRSACIRHFYTRTQETDGRHDCSQYKGVWYPNDHIPDGLCFKDSGDLELEPCTSVSKSVPKS